MRGTVGWCLLRLGQYFGSQLRRQLLGRLSRMERGQAHQTLFSVAPLPERDGGRRGVQFLFDVAVTSAFVQQQYDPHSDGDASRKIAAPQMRLQFAPLSGSQANARTQRHNHMTLPDLVKSTYRHSTVFHENSSCSVFRTERNLARVDLWTYSTRDQEGRIGLFGKQNKEPKHSSANAYRISS